MNWFKKRDLNSFLISFVALPGTLFFSPFVVLAVASGVMQVTDVIFARKINYSPEPTLVVGLSMFAWGAFASVGLGAFWYWASQLGVDGQVDSPRTKWTVATCISFGIASMLPVVVSALWDGGSNFVGLLGLSGCLIGLRAILQTLNVSARHDEPTASP